MTSDAGRIGTAYIDVEFDLGDLRKRIEQLVRDCRSEFGRIGESAVTSMREGMDGAEAEARKGGKKLAAQGEEAGRSFGDRLRDGFEAVHGKLEKAGIAAGAAMAAGTWQAIDREKLSDRVAASLGLSAKDSQRIGKLAGGLYADAYGDSLEQVNSAIGSVISSIDGMRSASDGALKLQTRRALDFSKTFEVDVTRAVQSVGTLMHSGLAKSGTQAFDLLTRASQRVPEHLREDILDASDEYAQFFSGLGFTGEQAFNALVAGSAKGVYGIDKMGDAVKEFAIRAVDGSALTKSAFDGLGLDMGALSNQILKGGSSAQKATQTIVSSLLSVKDPSKQAQMAIALFGTPLEDLNTGEIPEFLRGLQGAGNAMDGFAGATDRMGKTLNDNAGTRLEAFKRQALMGIQDAAANYVIPALDALVIVLEPLAPLIGGVVAAVAAYTVVTKIAAAITAAWNVLVGMSPWGRAALAVVALATAIGVLLTQHESLRDTAASAWASVSRAVSSAGAAVKSAAGSVLSTIASVPGRALELAKGIGSALVNGVVSGASSLASVLRSSLESSLYAAVTSLSPFSPVEHGGVKYIGKPLAEGAIKGWVTGAGELPATMEESIRNAVEKARAAVDNARGDFAGAWQRLAGDALSAFDRINEQVQTPTEKAIEAEREARKTAELQGAVDSARARVTAATTPEEVAAAQKSLDDALFAQREHAAEATIKQERKELDAQTAMRRRAFEDRLAELQKSLAREGATQAEGQERITALLASYGIDYSAVGVASGTAYADGLKKSTKAAVDAAAGIAAQVAEPLKVIPVAAEKADTKGASSAGGAAAGIAATGPVAMGATTKLSGALKNLAQDSSEAGTNVDELKRKMGELGSGLAAGTAVLSGLSLALIASRIEAVRTAAAFVAAKVAQGAAAVATGVLAAAQWALNAAMSANPLALVVVAIGALVAALIYAWNNSETFRTYVTAAWEAVKLAAETVFHAIAGVVLAVWDTITTTTIAVWEAVAGFLRGLWSGLVGTATAAFDLAKGAVTSAWGAIKSITSTVWDGIKAFLGGLWSAIKTTAAAVWDGIKTVIVDPVRSAASAIGSVWDSIKVAASTAWATLKGVASTAWDGIKSAIMQTVRDARDGIDDVWDSIKRRASTAWDGIKKAIGAAIDGLGGIIEVPLNVAGRGVTSIANAIIGVLNKIPGVNIGKVAWTDVDIGGDEKKASRSGYTAGGGGDVPGFARGGVMHHDQAKRGGKITRPMLIVGEEAPKDPEYTIPTNPAYRGRALGLFAELGGKLGVPGFATGGVFGEAMGIVSGVMKGGVKGLLSKLPGVDQLPEWLRGAGSHAIEKATGWIKEKVESLFRGKAGKVAKIIEFGDKVTALNQPYSYGGGHNGSFAPSADIRGKDAFGYDCSGLVSAALHAGGLIDQVLDTIGFKGYGEAGNGDILTIGVRGGAGLNGHTMLQVGDRHLESGSGHGARWVNGWSGSFPTRRHPAGFAEGGIMDREFWDIIDAQYFDPASPTFVGWGLREGGMFGGEPFVGSYKAGGTIPADGFAYVHQDERVIPADRDLFDDTSFDLYVQIGDGPVERVVDARIERRERRKAMAARGGVRS
ncbi:MAG: hypothetical protein PGN13_16370 [Patulibacter minatonensis]